MRVTLADIKQIIREERTRLAEAKKQAEERAPSSFQEFRLALAGAMKQAGAPDDLVHEVEDVDYEGGGVAAALAGAWHDYEYEVRDLPRTAGGVEMDVDGEKWDAFLDAVHDAVLNVADEYSNAWNYAPGRKATRFDPEDLASRVERVLSGAKLSKKKDGGPLKKPSGDYGPDDVLKPLAALVKEKIKGAKVAVRKGPAAGNSDDGPRLEVVLPNAEKAKKPSMRRRGPSFAEEDKPASKLARDLAKHASTVLRGLKADNIKQRDTGEGGIHVNAETYDDRTGIEKMFYLGIEDVAKGRARVWVDVEER